MHAHNTNTQLSSNGAWHYGWICPVIRSQKNNPGSGGVVFFAGLRAKPNAAGPRRTVELCRQYGQKAGEFFPLVESTEENQPTAPSLRCAFSRRENETWYSLPFGDWNPLPPTPQLEKMAKSRTSPAISQAGWANYRMLVETGKRALGVCLTNPFPIPCFRLGWRSFVGHAGSAKGLL